MPALALNWSIDSLKQALDVYFANSCVDIVAQTTSTNSVLLHRARQGDMRPTLLVAEQQTAGRGRMQRTWHSSQVAGNTLTFSMGVPMLPIQHISGLSVAVGCAVAESIDAKHAFGLHIKWPNDIWFQQRKLAGILIELCTQGAQTYAVVGIGINLAPVRVAAENNPPQAKPQAPAWVHEFAPHTQAPELLHAIVPTLAHTLAHFGAEGLLHWQQLFQARDALKNTVVDVSDNTSNISGTAQGVRNDGALKLQTAHGMQYITSSEVRVRTS